MLRSQWPCKSWCRNPGEQTGRGVQWRAEARLLTAQISGRWETPAAGERQLVAGEGITALTETTLAYRMRWLGGTKAKLTRCATGQSW
jgi:hypothetical protein